MDCCEKIFTISFVCKNIYIFFICGGYISHMSLLEKINIKQIVRCSCHEKERERERVEPRCRNCKFIKFSGKGNPSTENITF